MFQLSLCLVVLVSFIAITQAKSPNIIWIMSDDMGWGEPENFPSTSPHGTLSTPNLAKFGSEGIVFDQAYAGYTVCAPSRTTFMTGYHSGHFPRQGFNGEALDSSQTKVSVGTV